MAPEITSQPPIPDKRLVTANPKGFRIQEPGGGEVKEIKVPKFTRKQIADLAKVTADAMKQHDPSGMAALVEKINQGEGKLSQDVIVELTKKILAAIGDVPSKDNSKQD